MKIQGGRFDFSSKSSWFMFFLVQANKIHRKIKI